MSRERVSLRLTESNTVSAEIKALARGERECGDFPQAGQGLNCTVLVNGATVNRLQKRFLQWIFSDAGISGKERWDAAIRN